MKISDVATRMREIADEIKAEHPTASAELVALAEELKRRSPVVRSIVTSAPMTPKLKQAIREYALDNPLLSYQAIARKFEVNPGRVSETLRGKRT